MCTFFRDVVSCPFEVGVTDAPDADALSFEAVDLSDSVARKASVSALAKRD